MRKKKKIVKKPDRTPLVLAGIAVCIGIIIFWAARKDMSREEIPDYLVGKWLTSAPGYEDRYLEINKVSLLFATSESTVNEYFIDKNATAAAGKQIFFTFECKDLENSPYRFSLSYEPDNGGVLSFKNQSHITWRKETP